MVWAKLSSVKKAVKKNQRQTDQQICSIMKSHASRPVRVDRASLSSPINTAISRFIVTSLQAHRLG